MSQEGTPKQAFVAKKYTKEDLDRAKQAMLESLAAVSGGRLVPGCCTQDCCDAEAQGWFMDLRDTRIPPVKKTYSREDLALAKQAMLQKLAELSGGGLVAGCCTQGCCDPDAQDWAINPAP